MFTVVFFKNVDHEQLNMDKWKASQQILNLIIEFLELLITFSGQTFVYCYKIYHFVLEFT